MSTAAMKRRRFDSLEQEVFLNLWRTYDRLRALEDELFSQHQLTPQQYNVLRLLRGEHPERVATLALAAKLVSRAPNITRMLDELESRGLIVRDRLTTDRRTVHVGITPAGLALLKELDKGVRECHARQLGHLAAADLKTLARLLKEARRPLEKPDSPWL